MGTIAQEISRIQGAKSDLATSITNKGVTVPAATKIDGYAALVDQIQQGGGQENPFLTETDLSYMFDYRKSSDAKIIAGIQRMSQNNITNMSRSFDHFNDDDPNEDILALIQNMIIAYPNADKSYMLNYYTVNENYSGTLNISTAALGGSMSHFMYRLFGGSIVGGHNRKIDIVIGNNTFSNVTDLSFCFSEIISNEDCYLKLTGNRLNINCNCNYMFSETDGLYFINNNDEDIYDLTVDFSGASSTLTATNMFYNYDQFNSVNIVGGNKVSDYTNMFRNCYTIVGVTGVDFSNISGASNGNLFNTSGSTYYDDLGEFGIVNGSALRNGTMTLNLSKIWHGTTSATRDGQTIGYWYEKFANALGNKVYSGTQTITINTTLYNSLTPAQIALITDKGYTLAHAA